MTILPVLTGSTGNGDLAELANATGGHVRTISQESLLAAIGRDHVQELIGGFKLNFAVPLSLELVAGDVVDLGLTLEGYEGRVDAQFTAPIGPEHQNPGIFVSISSGSNSMVRPLIGLGENYNY